MAEAEIQALKEQVEGLMADVQKEQDKNIQLEEQKVKLEDDLKEKDGAPGAGGAPGVFVTRERKIEKFSGKPVKTGDPEVWEWTEEVRGYFQSRAFNAKERVDFILQHLGGIAKAEIQYHPKEFRENSDEILKTLEKTFGIQDSVAALQQKFYIRAQLESESVLEYSVALLKMSAKVIEKSPELEGSHDLMLKGRFVEGVKDPVLRKDLKRESEENLHLTFWDIREKALKWEDQKEKKNVTVKEITATNKTDSNEANSKLGSGLKSLETLMLKQGEAVKKQQIQLDKLAETLKQVQSPRFGSSTGVATVTGGTSSKGNTVPFSKLKEIPCKFIGTEKGCWKGDKCFFSHDSAGASGKASYDNSNIYCYVCGVPGHTASRCEHKKKRLEDR